MEFSEQKGDLFTDSPETDGLVHCVSADFHMSKGIAVAFKKTFGGVGELLSQGRKVGQVAVLDRPPRAGVFYLVTKPKYHHKPTLASMRACIEDLRRVCDERQVTGLSMPRIGCGLDKLDWGDVQDLLREVFKNTRMRIRVFYL